ncbi:DUF58 domain-containing protein [Phreatobacter stygius]|uniref:DUF58 domain-containing protein n=1 Tax=Phreatobacter stygius TaxID=1940610 RepID=A0A4D7BKH4_9HYPH|nr:DUF58 domain-containing protein [Phreatobacter stygius]QCI68252.1 DUF58 domain-containing protein [Phreatobacter stygius]
MVATASTGPDKGVYADLNDLVALEYRSRGFSLLPRQPVHSLLTGRHASRMRGRGLDFSEIRTYRPGDDVRSIDWRATARLARPQVRIFNEERDRRTFLVVDQRLSMFFGSRVAMKSVTAAELAAAAAWRVIKAGDRVGAIVFDDSSSTSVEPQRNRRTVLRIFHEILVKNRALGVDRAITPQPAMLNVALKSVAGLARHDDTILVVSDFDGADAETRRMVIEMALHSDVLAALVHDPLQSALPDAGQVTITDGQAQLALDLGHAPTRDRVLDMSRQRLADIRSWDRELGIPVLPISTADDPVLQVRALLGKAQAARRRTPRGNGGG